MHYRLCQQDRIIEVCSGWDRNARLNDGSSAIEDRIIGYPIWSFVRGRAASSYLNALFFSARQKGRELSVEYRCDAPDMLRWCTMTIVPETNGGLLVRHDLQRQRRRVPDPARAATPGFSQCVQCLRENTGDDWVEAGVEALRARPEIQLVVCPDCRAAALAAIEQATTRRLRTAS